MWSKFQLSPPFISLSKEKALLSQPEKALTAKMKTSQIAFTLALLVLNESKADKVTSCIQCESFPAQENSECIAGTGKGSQS